MVTIEILDGDFDKYSFSRSSSILGRMYDNESEFIQVMKPECENSSVCTMIVTHGDQVIDHLTINDKPIPIRNNLTQYTDVCIGFSFSREDGYIKNSEIKLFSFLRAQNPNSDFVPVEPQQKLNLDHLIGQGFIRSELNGKMLEFYNINDEVVDKVDLASFLSDIDNKVDKELKTDSETEYKVLSDNNYTDTEKKNLSELIKMKEGDEFGKVDDIQINDSSIVKDKIANIQLITGFEDESEDKFSSVKNTTILNKKIDLLNNDKVDKEEGKSLSTNDYTDEDKNKLSGIEEGAQVNTLTSVAGKTGDVVLSKTDVGLENVDNTSDMDKPISTAQQEEFNKKADTEKVVLLNKEGTQNITSNVAILGDLNINGNIIQQGSTYETHTETVYTKNDYIITRDGAVSGLGNGEYTGIIAKSYDGTNDGGLIFDNKGVARVGDIGDEQPLATREEAPIDKSLVSWDEGNNKFVTHSNIKFSDGKLLYNDSEILNVADEQTITGNKNYKGILTFNNAIYLTNIADSVKDSVSKIYFGNKVNPYAYISANIAGAFGIFNAAGNGIVCYPENNFFPLGASLDLGRTNNKWKDLYLSGKITDGTNSYSINDLSVKFTEINNNLENKQSTSDETLSTTDKTIVGAINELNTKIIAANTQLEDILGE